MVYRIVVVFLFTFLYIVVAAGLYVAVQMYTGQMSPNPSVIPGAPPVAVDPFKDLGGTLYLTLPEEETNRALMYTYDIEADELAVIPNDDFVSFFPTPVSDNEIIFFAAPHVPNEEYPLPYVDFMHVYKRNLDTGEQEILSDNDVDLRRRPVWAPESGKLAFYGLSEQGTNSHSINHYPFDDWELFISDLDGENREMIANALSPSWSADGKRLYYLAGDGVNRFNLDTGLPEKVMSPSSGPDGFIGVPIGIRVSTDEEHLMWTDPASHSMELFKINSVEPFNAERVLHITLNDDQRVYWPTFSPDGRYVVYAFVNDRADGAYVTMQVLDTVTFQRKNILDLGKIDLFNPPAPTWVATK